MLIKYLIVSTILFVTGLAGMFLARQHLIIILMALELILLSANLNFIIFAVFHDDLLGQLFSLLILTVGAAETAIGLAILIVYFRLKGSVAIDLIQTLKG